MLQTLAGLEKKEVGPDTKGPSLPVSERLTNDRASMAESIDRARDLADWISDALREHSDLQPLYDASERDQSGTDV
ncbi:hypothetical protein A5N75_21605 [Prescottella equi]|nr:hypothetical protein A6F56_21645 [Prescottella equi]ORL05444.1 hypothetical protein A6I84_20020 [Prescottella equi]ORL72047.1 hypothetical protein A5N75_21605 [Prescottella equi]ORL86930.1 hypothetical protein A5N76_21370 [Prescottella equi]BDE58655.1 hypothetical protein REA19_16710 [Prescottella equi]